MYASSLNGKCVVFQHIRLTDKKKKMIPDIIRNQNLFNQIIKDCNSVKDYTKLLRNSEILIVTREYDRFLYRKLQGFNKWLRFIMKTTISSQGSYTHIHILSVKMCNLSFCGFSKENKKLFTWISILWNYTKFWWKPNSALCFKLRSTLQRKKNFNYMSTIFLFAHLFRRLYQFPFRKYHINVPFWCFTLRTVVFHFLIEGCKMK